jgi:hypothetical protein
MKFRNIVVVVALVLISSAPVAVVGCSSTPATIADAGSGNTDATTDANKPDTGTCVDPADCETCSGVRQPQCRTRPVCACNKSATQEASTVNIQALRKCVCDDACAVECTASCSAGAARTPACDMCIGQKCLAQATACAKDVARDPACKPSPPDAGSDAAPADAATD